MKTIGIKHCSFSRPCTRLRVTENDVKESKKIKLERGFRWDPALQRWIEEKRNVGKEFDVSDMTVKTKTGDEYVVSSTSKVIVCDAPLETLDKMKQGYTLLDVRLTRDYDKSHAEGSVHVPLFRDITRDNTWSQIKKVVSFLMNMAPTERNTDFTKQVAELVPSKSKIIVMCSRGGTLETVIVGPGENPKTCKDPDRAFGRETRSLKAIYELFQDGFEDMYYVKGGYGQWIYDRLPTVDS